MIAKPALVCGFVLASYASEAMAQPLPNPYPDASPIESVEPVATALVARAEQLLSLKLFADAKQLAVESLQLLPSAALAERASKVLASADAALGITTSPATANGGPGSSSSWVDTSASAGASDAAVISDAVAQPLTARSRDQAETAQRNDVSAAVHGALIGATLTAGLTLQISGATNAAAGGVAGALLGAYVGNQNRRRLSPGDTRTVGSGAMWASVVGGLVVDVATYRNGATRQQIALGVSLGTLVGGMAGYGLARHRHYTPGEVGMIDGLALLGGGAGLSLGFLMQPATAQAYSANTALGLTAGFVFGAVLAKRWSPSEARVLRITAAASLGGVLPWLGYAASNGGASAQQWAGGLSVGCSIGGAWLGHYLTRQTASNNRVEPTAASPALVQRSASGHWRLGVSAPRTVGRDLSSDSATVFDVAAGRF